MIMNESKLLGAYQGKEGGEGCTGDQITTSCSDAVYGHMGYLVQE